VQGGGVQATHSVIWFRTLRIPKDGQATFKYAPDFYAFVGNTNTDSSHLKAKDMVDLHSSLVAKTGSIRNDGDQMLVSSSLELHRIDGRASQGTFQILTEIQIPYPNSWIVGVARKHEWDEPRPVAVVELKPGVDYTFTPGKAVFVRAMDLEPGSLHTFHNTSDENVAKVMFRGALCQALVTEHSDGKFTVTYR
jgi:hypothetical protein